MKCIGLMLIFAIISYKYIERPLRQAKWSSVNRLTIGYGLSASMGAALVCFVFLSNKTILILPSFVRPPDFLPLELSGLPYDPTCVVDGDKRPLKADTFDLCTVLPKIKNGKRIWALGDSHAGHLQGLLYSVYERAGLGVHLIETPGQSFPLSRGTKFEPRDIIFEQIKGNLHIGDIVLLSRLFLDRRNGKKVSDLSFWLEDVIRFARSLSLKGVSVVIVGPPPMFKFENINTCMSMWSGSSYCDVYRTSILADIKEVYDIIEESTKQQGNIYTFNQFEILCPESNVKCSPSRKGVFLFRDKDHLNSLGSASLSDHFMQFLHDNGLLDHSKINNTEEKS